MTEIKILIYTDTARILMDGDDWSVTKLRERLEAKMSEFVEFKVQIVNRYQGAEEGKPPTPVRITDELLRDVDQIWFFGLYQNKTGVNFNLISGSDQNELSEAEIGVLNDRMNNHGLGVLVSGDHSIHRPTGSGSDPVETFICLGKAIGARVPRARQLRTWDGPPTNDKDTSFSTLADAVPFAEEDERPQRLALFNFAAGGSATQPHRLFLGRDENGKDTTIDILPDHPHEGEVIVPKSLESDWPPFNEPDGKKKLPRPLVVALGFDRRVNRAAPVLAVYDGDSHKVGRIVADSSWHHFFNVNLAGISKNPSPGSAFDLLGQLYRNLAHYLTPLAKRQQIAKEMLKWVMSHPGMLEERGGDPLRLGRAARHYLSKVSTPFEIAEMLQVSTPDDLKVTDPPVEFTTLDSDGTNPLPTQEAILGSIVGLNFSVASKQLKAELEGAPLTDSDSQPTGDADIVEEGIRAAFRYHSARLAQLASAAQNFSDRQNPAANAKEVKMASTVCQGTDEWRNSKLTPNGKPEEDDGRFVITKRKDGTFEGTHTDKDGKDTTLTEIACQGVNGTLSFKRENDKVVIRYRGTIEDDGLDGFKITKITGKFDRDFKAAPVAEDVGQPGDKEEEDGRIDASDTGDWSAEKPGA